MKFIKHFENNNQGDLEVIATNECYWSWEYDAQTRTAQILWDRNSPSGELWLHIRSVHVKSGLGAGSFPKDLVYERVGKILNPDLGKIRTLLTKNNYSSQVRFKRDWIDANGNSLPLGNIIKNVNNRANKLINLNKVAKDKTLKREIPTEEFDLRISPWGKAYVIYGAGTKELKDEIKMQLNGKFYTHLQNPETGEKLMAWMIAPWKLEDAKTLTGVSEITPWNI